VVGLLAREIGGSLLESCGVFLGLVAVGRGGTPALRALILDAALVEVDVPGVGWVGETSPEAEADALAASVVRTDATELGRLDVVLGTVACTLVAAPVRAVALVVRRRSGLEGNARLFVLRGAFLDGGEMGIVFPVVLDFCW
jgi:hypothetical protein